MSDNTTAPAYEVRYSHPRKHTETLRAITPEGKRSYYLRCTDHDYVHPLARLTDDRALHRAGRHTWCPGCAGRRDAIRFKAGEPTPAQQHAIDEYHGRIELDPDAVRVVMGTELENGQFVYDFSNGSQFKVPAEK